MNASRFTRRSKLEIAMLAAAGHSNADIIGRTFKCADGRMRHPRRGTIRVAIRWARSLPSTAAVYLEPEPPTRGRGPMYTRPNANTEAIMRAVESVCPETPARVFVAMSLGVSVRMVAASLGILPAIVRAAYRRMAVRYAGDLDIRQRCDAARDAAIRRADVRRYPGGRKRGARAADMFDDREPSSTEAPREIPV